MADIKQIHVNDATYDFKDEVARDTLDTLRQEVEGKQDTITAVINPTITDDGGSPSASATFEDGELNISFKNLKLRFSDLSSSDKEQIKGGQGDSAVFDPETGNILATLHNTIGSDDANAMTQKAVTEELVIEKGLIGISSLSTINYYISVADNKWHSSQGGAKWLFVPVEAGDIFVIKAKDDENANYAFLKSKKSSYSSNETPDFTDDVSSITVLPEKGINIETAPSGANWLYVLVLSSSIDVSPEIAKAEKSKENIKELLAEMDEVRNSIFVDGDVVNYNDLTKYERYISADNVWAQQPTASQANCVMIPVTAGKSYSIKSSESSYTTFAFLSTDNIVVGERPDFAYGIDGRTTIAMGRIRKVVVAPSDATYLYLLTKISNVFCLPEVRTLKNISEAALLVKDSKVGVEEVDLEAFPHGNSYIASNGNWTRGTEGCCVIVPMNPCAVLSISAREDAYTSVAFLTDNVISTGSSAHFAGGSNAGRTVISMNKSVELTAPIDTKYLYVYMRSSSQNNMPKVCVINTPTGEQVENLSVDGMRFNAVAWVEEYKDVMIGEDGVLVEDNNSIVRKYTIGTGTYYANSFYGSNEDTFPVAYYDSEDNFLDFDEAFAKVDFVKKTTRMKMTIPSDTAYALVRGTKTSYSSPWPPFVYKGSWQTNKDVTPLSIEYHTSMIQKNILVSDGDTDPTSGTRIEPTMAESGWAVMWPTSYTRCGKPTQVVAMLHGVSGYVTPSVMGYPQGSVPDWTKWRNRYLQEGYAVLDINGFGTTQDERMHYGCPAAVETLNKAFEYLKANYNVADRMLIHGTSMGGALAQTYTRTYPGNVIAVAMFAPVCIMWSLISWSDLLMPKWGYENLEDAKADNYSNMAGFVPFAKTMALKNGSLVEMVWNDHNSYEEYEPIERFPVPVRIWHGTNDANVMLSLSQYTIEAFRKGGAEATLRICDGETHDLSTGSAQYVIDESIDYFRRYAE